MAASATPRNTEPPSSRCVAVAFSGGRDSTALLHATLREAASLGLRVAALHVHHGLVPQADEWVRTLARRCAQWKRRGAPLSFHFTRLQGRPTPGESVEAWARKGRYAALDTMAREAGASLLLLAHHRRDQAETFVLQALRGGGAAGLSAMPRVAHRCGLVWARPWLDLPREAIEAYVRRHRLHWIEDESNEHERFARNRLRVRAWPELLRAMPDAEASLAAAAARAQEEAACLEEVAAQDLAAVTSDDGALSLLDWSSHSPSRRANALRAWLKARLGRGAPESLVQRLLRELPSSGKPATWPAGEGDLQRYRGRLEWRAATGPDRRGAATALEIRDFGRHPVPDWGGVLVVDPAPQGGIAMARLAGLELRPRAGAEQFQRAPGSTARSLKKQFQAAGIAAWARNAPLLYCEGQLVYVPGLGLDARALAPAGVVQCVLRWESAPSAASGKP